MKAKSILAGFPLVGLIAASLCLGQSAGTPEKGTPERMADGRVAPTTTADASDDQGQAPSIEDQIAKLETANKMRDKLLAKFPLPLAVAVRIPDGSINVDKMTGKLDEPVWKNAQVITDLKDKNGDVVKEQTRVRLLWDSKYLYIGVECDDTDITAAATDRDGEVYNDDCIETFINPTGDEMSYLQLDVNPLGTWYDSTIADYNPAATWKPGAKELDMDKAASSFNTKDSKWVVKVDGTPNSPDPSKDNKGWSVEMAIAWSDIDRGTNVIHKVPQDGDVMRMNFGRINISSGGGDSVYSLWNPTGGWNHVPWMFGRVVFISGEGQPADNAATQPASDDSNK